MMRATTIRMIKLHNILFCSLVVFIISCDKEYNNASNVAGTYTGTAMIEEQFFRNGIVIYDTSFTTSDQLIVSEIDASNRQYHFELKSNFITFLNQAPLDPIEYTLDENYIVWEGLDEFGYTYDNKKHWKFDPEQDTVYFFLARSPYGPTIIDNPHPDSVGYYDEELHIWTYVLSATRQ